MFCPNCGTQIPEGCSFCPNCGTKVAPPVTQAAAGTAPAAAVPAGVPRPKKGAGKLILPVAVVVVIVLLVVLLRGILGGSRIQGEFVYLGSGNYYLLKDIAKDPVQFASLRDSEQVLGLVTFSPDGNYLYYFSKVDDANLTGTLCRAQISKIREGDSGTASETLDSDVRIYEDQVLKDNSVIYLDGDDNLKYYHDGQSVRIAQNVSSFDLLEDESCLVYRQKGEDYTSPTALYGVELSSPENSVKLAGDADYVSEFSSRDCILYCTTDDETYDRSLYRTDFSGNVQLLAEDVQLQYTNSDDSIFYYLAPNGSKLNLYSYVDDPLAAQDASATEPSYDNYKIPYYTYWNLNTGADPGAYAELYTSCTHGLRLLSGGWDSMEEVVDDTFGTYSQATKNAVQAFIDKYEDTQDDNGYLLVTDQVRNDLKAISSTMEGAEAGDWIALCCHKEQSGTTTDYEAYNQDLEKYNAALNRIALREDLQAPEQQSDVLALHAFSLSDLSDTVVLDNLGAVRFTMNNRIGYRTVDQLTDKISIEDVESVYSVTDWLNAMESGTVSVFDLKSGQPTLTMAGEDFSRVESLYRCGDHVLIHTDDQELLDAPVSNGTVGSFSLLAEDVQVDAGPDDGSLYYYADTYQNSDDITYGDFYRYADGTSTRLVQDTETYGVTVFEDGTMLAGDRTDTNDAGLSVYDMILVNDKGESSYLADGVTQVFFFGKDNILYVSDGDLYHYNGKERELLVQGVDYLWSNAETEKQVNTYY